MECREADGMEGMPARPMDMDRQTDATTTTDSPESRDCRVTRTFSADQMQRLFFATEIPIVEHIVVRQRNYTNGLPQCTAMAYSIPYQCLGPLFVFTQQALS